MLGKKRTLTWDSESRLSAVADNGHTTRYTYDHAGRRVIKRGVGGETAWVNNMWTVRNRAIGTKHVFVGNNPATPHHIWDFSRRNCDPFRIIQDH